MSRLQKAVALVAAIVVLLLVLGTIFYDKIDVVASNMAPTLQPGDAVVVRDGASATVNDIVLFELPSSTGEDVRLALSRVVAVGGQEVTLRDGEVFIDDVLVAEPFLARPSSTDVRLPIPGCDQAAADEARCVVPDGSVFLMGDNRSGSSDSRQYGPVDTDTVRGVVTGSPFWLPEFLIVG